MTAPFRYYALRLCPMGGRFIRLIRQSFRHFRPLSLTAFRATLESMFGLSLGHLIVLLVVVLLFGSRKLPELGSALGRGMHAFKKGLEGKDERGNDHHDDQDKLT